MLVRLRTVTTEGDTTYKVTIVGAIPNTMLRLLSTTSLFVVEPLMRSPMASPQIRDGVCFIASPMWSLVSGSKSFPYYSMLFGWGIPSKNPVVVFSVPWRVFSKPSTSLSLDARLRVDWGFSERNTCQLKSSIENKWGLTRQLLGTGKDCAAVRRVRAGRIPVTRGRSI